MGQVKPHAGGASCPCTYVTTHFSIRTTVETLATTNVETGLDFLKHRSGQTICEYVRELGGRRYV
jgi:hypothetical protein